VPSFLPAHSCQSSVCFGSIPGWSNPAIERASTSSLVLNRSISTPTAAAVLSIAIPGLAIETAAGGAVLPNQDSWWAGYPASKRWTERALDTVRTWLFLAWLALHLLYGVLKQAFEYP